MKQGVWRTGPKTLLALYAVSLTDELFKQYGIKPEERRPTVVSERRWAYVHDPWGKPQVRFGKNFLEYAYCGGDFGYCCADKKVWPRPACGLEAVWRVVVHEFAHVLQGRCTKRVWGSVHGLDFLACLEELCVLAPFEDYGVGWFSEVCKGLNAFDKAILAAEL